MSPWDEGGRAAGTDRFPAGVRGFFAHALADAQCSGPALPGLIWALRFGPPAASRSKSDRHSAGARISHGHGGVLCCSLSTGISPDGIVAAAFSSVAAVISLHSVFPPWSLSYARDCGDAADRQAGRRTERRNLPSVNPP